MRNASKSKERLIEEPEALRLRTAGLGKLEAERKLGEEEEKYIHDLAFLSRTAMGFLELSPEEDIYEFIGRQLKELVGNSIIIMNSFDGASDSLCVRALLGVGEKMGTVLRILGKHPVGTFFTINDEARLGLTSGKLVKVPGGLYELSFGEIPRAICRAIEELLGLGDIYAMGFAWKGELFGNASILTRKGTELRDQSLIETFVNQASVALQRKQAEEALHRAHGELEIRVQERTAELARANEALQAEITERKQAEEKLQQQNEFLNNILESLTHPFYVIDANDYTIKLANSAAKLGNLSESLTCHALTHKSSQPCGRVGHACPLGEVKKTKKPVVAEHIHYDADGSARNVEVHGYPILDTEGNVIQMIEYCLDITERKRAEEALKESEQRFRAVITNAPIVIFMLDREGKFMLSEGKGLQVLGLKPGEVVGQSAFDVYADVPEIVRNIRRALKGDEFTEVVPVGELFFETWYSPMRDQNGEVSGVIGVATDITKHKRAEEALKESEEKLKTILENTRDVIFQLSPLGIIQYVSPEVKEIYGYKPEDLIGKYLKKTTPISEVPKALEALKRVLAGKAISNFEINQLDANGKIVRMEINATPVRKDGKIIAVQGVMRDITERKQAEERERQMQQELNLSSRLASIGELASGVAHEINNPLTAVIGFSQILMDRDIPKDIKQDLKIVNDNAQRVAKIVKSLLTFARQRKEGKEYVDINSIVLRVLELRTYEMKLSDIEVTTQLAPDLPWTMANTGQLQQVFLNIILNAEQAMTKAHNKGKLSVKTRQIGNSIRVSFEDDGPGIASKHLDRVFDPFFTTKGIAKGTGLGLSVSYGIIKEHNGRIYATSGLGKGATFFVELPIVAEVQQLKLAETAVEEPRRVTGARIMVVDDEPTICQFLSRVLTQEGHNVETIDNASAALERLERERYNLVLLDIKMAGMNGINLYRHMGKIAPSLQRRVIFITGDTMTSDTRDFLDTTKARYISKPFDAEQLKKDINQILIEKSI